MVTGLRLRPSLDKEHCKLSINAINVYLYCIQISHVSNACVISHSPVNANVNNRTLDPNSRWDGKLKPISIHDVYCRLLRPALTLQNIFSLRMK